jgi:hypothetical protein
MAFAKLVKVCQDFALGIQSINGAISNLETFFSAWTAKHGKQETVVGSLPTTTNPYETFGHHNEPAIPRAILNISIVTWAPGSTAFIVGSQGPIRAVTRVATGVWSIEMDGHLDTFWGIAHPIHSAAADIRYCKPTSYFPTGPGSPSGVIVSTYSSTGGAASVLTEYAFTCTIYGYTAPAASSVASMAVAPGRFSKRRPMWMRFKRKR